MKTRVRQPGRAQKFWVVLGIVAAVPWLIAPSCIEGDPYYVDASTPLDSGTSTTATSTGSDAGMVSVFVPARPCRSSGNISGPIARLRVINRDYAIDCGCAEAMGHACTIPAGTTVIWSFSDSEEHDISSVGGAFGESGEKLAGTWSVRFDEPGVYPYLCNIHSADMNGYSIVVR